MKRNEMAIRSYITLVLGLSMLLAWPAGRVLGRTAKEFVVLTDAQKHKVLGRTEEFYKGMDLPKFTARGAKATYVSMGAIVAEETDNSELDLDTDPCNGVIDVFHRPYKKTLLSKTKNCLGKTVTYYQVEQLEAQP